MASSGFSFFAFYFDTELFVFLGQPSYLGRYRISSQFFRVEEKTGWVTLKLSCTKTIRQQQMVLYLRTSTVALTISALIPRSQHPSHQDSCWAWQTFLQLPWVWLGRSQLIHCKRVVCLFFLTEINFRLQRSLAQYWNHSIATVETDVKLIQFQLFYHVPVVRIFFLSVYAGLTRFILYLVFTDDFAFLLYPLFAFFTSGFVKF